MKELGIPDTVDEAIRVLAVERVTADWWARALAEDPARLADYCESRFHRVGIDGPVGQFYGWEVLMRAARAAAKGGAA
jgi:hypothetical protein